MATPPRPSTASSRLRTKTSELSDLLRGRQHSSTSTSTSTPSTDPSPKAKRKIPLFSLRKKSPATPNAPRHPTPPPVPTPRPSTNACVFLPSSFHPLSSFLNLIYNIGRLQSLRKAIPKHSFHNSRSHPPPSLHYPHLTTRLLPNDPRFHLQTQDLRGR
ncbi:hypothetical protein BJV74DRAFT_470097 [Russula compacta]|nr:hypothetical protein BJV74DRAFT_470097 [Russula compacta]